MVPSPSSPGTIAEFGARRITLSGAPEGIVAVGATPAPAVAILDRAARPLLRTVSVSAVSICLVGYFGDYVVDGLAGLVADVISARLDVDDDIRHRIERVLAGVTVAGFLGL